MHGLKNMMEETVLQRLETLLPDSGYCSCEECKLEMATYALNRLPPKYTCSKTGEILHQFDTSVTQMDIEITSCVLNAMRKIGEKPHHTN